MNITYYDGAALICIAVIVWGIRLMNSPKTARFGNVLGAVSLMGAVALTLFKNGILDKTLLWIAMAIGGLAGYYIAAKVTMLKMPQMIALLNGLGGGASALVAVMILSGNQSISDLFSRITAVLALIVGGVTLSGSLIAAAKLDQRISQRPIRLKRHSLILGIISVALLVIMILMVYTSSSSSILILTILMSAFSLLLGIVFTIRVGGADMPITISLLNSLSGLAGAIAGFAIYDPLLIAVGGIVGAAGLILTQVMCRGMNRSLSQVLTGGNTALASRGAVKTAGTGITCEKVADNKASKEIEEGAIEASIAVFAGDTAEKATKEHAEEAAASKEDDDTRIKRIIDESKSIIIVPGYGMALAQAQYQVKDLYDRLIQNGKNVRFAIHPVAGRMPGHMNVLLAEVDIPYEKLFELNAINDDFSSTDLAIAIGANDVINPAANTAEGTPIYGMPILNVDQAKHIIIYNRDTNPGYAGVPNTLYKLDKVILKLGDAKETMASII